MNEPATNKSFSKLVSEYEQKMASEAVDGFDATMAVIDEMNATQKNLGLLAAGNEVWVVEHWYTRLAARITAWAVDPQTVLNLERLQALVKRKNELIYIFAASGFRNMRHLAHLMNTNTSDDEALKIPGPKCVVLLALLGLDELTPDLFRLADRLDQQVLFQLYVGWLNQRAVVTKQGESNRGKLLTSSERLQGTQVGDTHVGLMVNSYMYCSYASHPQRHQFKETLNTLMTEAMANIGVDYANNRKRKTKRPTVLVIHERFLHKHAMFRCYAPHIRAMKDRFSLIALAETDKIDAPAEALFEQVHKLEAKESKPIKKLAAFIDKIKPDIIYYPSLGMSHWTVMLSNLRLAPVQVMSLGHPATSRSRQIDYVLAQFLEGDPTETHSEIVLMTEQNVAFDQHPDLPENLPEPVAPSDRVVRIAVNSKVMKLSHRLFEICRRLSREASVTVEFQFFPGELGWYTDGITALIKSHLPDARVSPYQEYDQFLSQIAQCDMALSAFPFGNTNSTVDTCLLGIPAVVHFGPEPPAQTDKMVLKVAGHPDWLVCDNDEAYFQAALRLIEDVDLRQSVTAGLDREEVRRRLIPPNGSGIDPEFRDLLWWAYQNHESIVSGSQRLFRWSELPK